MIFSSNITKQTFFIDSRGIIFELPCVSNVDRYGNGGNIQIDRREGCYLINGVSVYFRTDEERKEQTLLQLPQIVSDIQQRGIKLGSVAILIRKNSQAKPIADCLLEAGIKVMSNEALLLNQSLEVSLLLNMLRLSLSPDDKLLRFLTSYQYQLFLTSDSNLSLSSVLNNQVQLPQLPAFNSLQEQVTQV